MYFKPVLSNGKKVPLPWQLCFGPFGILMPLQDHPVRWMKIADMLLTCVTLCSFLFVLEAAANHFFKNLNDIMAVTESLATLAQYNDCVLRVCSMALGKFALKLLLKQFYHEIYISEEENFKINQRIKRSIAIPTKFYSFFYLFALSGFCLSPILSAVLYGRRIFPNGLEFHHDVSDRLIFAVTLGFHFLNGACTIFMLSGDFYLLANFVEHLCARYEMLEDDLKKSADLLCNVSPFKVSQEFHTVIKEAIRRTQNWNKFGKLLRATYSFRLFSLIIHGGIILCSVTFQTTKSEFGTGMHAAFVSWMAGKFLELIIFGYLGSKFLASTNTASSTFFNCNWEDIISRSTNTKQNIMLMKEIQLAISIFHKPLELSALGFFDPFSLLTAASLIRLAGSYYMFLNTFQ